MSEYQYYEFQAIDRPLSEKDVRELRSYSTRAVITATRFTNHYEWGNFKGDEDAWMAKYFDAFLYLANWGTRVLKLRWPSAILPPATARLYAPGGAARMRKTKDKSVITWCSDDEDSWDWIEGEGDLAAILPVRDEIARGDLRSLYLGWLLAVESGDSDDDKLEPPVPPNLKRLSASQQALVEFLRIDGHLLSAASQASPSIKHDSPNQKVLAEWAAKLPLCEKDRILVRLMNDQGSTLTRELLSRFEKERAASTGGAESKGMKRRTVAELLEAADEQRRIAAQKAARAVACRKREIGKARERYLDSLVDREDAVWIEVEQLIAARQPKTYARAVELLIDLRDLSARGSETAFSQRLQALRAAHARKLTFLERLRAAGL